MQLSRPGSGIDVLVLFVVGALVVLGIMGLIASAVL